MTFVVVAVGSEDYNPKNQNFTFKIVIQKVFFITIRLMLCPDKLEESSLTCHSLGTNLPWNRLLDGEGH